MFNLVILGILVSVIFYELTDISPGGIIVPGLLAAYIFEPLHILYTVAISLLAYGLVKLFSRWFIVFGKRRFVLIVLVSLFLHLIIDGIFAFFFVNLAHLGLSLVGYVVSGLLADNIYKQGIIKTLSALTIVVCILGLLIVVLTQFGVVL